MMSENIVLSNRYQLLDQFGSGGMAVVYRARDLTLERDVAIKILRENYSHDSSFQDLFRQEAKSAANLTHPNVVTVHDFGLDKGRLFIVMEYVPGEHLKEILKIRKQLSIEDTLILMIQACAGVGAAHREGLIHCDIKPHNFLITPENQLKVTDFGIAKALASLQPEQRNEIVWGSPQYFSPEQAAGKVPSPASDVYSLGVVMYEMLTGRLPFYSTSAKELARMHRESLPPPPRQFSSNIPSDLEQIILLVLAKEPSVRYRNAIQFGQVLNTYYQQAVPDKVSQSGEIDELLLTSTRRSSTNAPTINGYIPDQEIPEDHIGPSQAAQSSNEINPLDVDWVTIFLGLLTLIAVGGLIPFYLWIYFLYQ